MKVINLKEKLKPYLLLAPVLFVLIGIFLFGISMALLQSLGYFPAVGLNEFTFRYYQEVLKNKDFFASLRFSLYTSFISSAIAIIIGVLLSYAILQLRNGRQMVEYLFRLPVIVPHLVAVLLMVNTLSQTGIFPRLLYHIGWINDHSHFPAVLYGKNGVGIMLVYLWKGIPFVAITTYGILSKVSSKLSDVAYNLGANKRQVFFYVILPLIMPSILSSLIIIFAFSFGAYEVPLLLGPTNPKTLSVQAFIEYNNPVLYNRPYAMVINILMILIAMALTWLYMKAFERIYQYER